MRTRSNRPLIVAGLAAWAALLAIALGVDAAVSGDHEPFDTVLAVCAADASTADACD